MIGCLENKISIVDTLEERKKDMVQSEYKVTSYGNVTVTSKNFSFINNEKSLKVRLSEWEIAQRI